jgi:hypothetical protein
MCYGCYVDEFGSPTIVNEATKRVAELCRQLYEISAVGGNCHIVTDDWNLEDENIRFCLDYWERAGGWQDEVLDPKRRAIEKELLDLMIPMSEAERASALGIWEGFVKVTG